jgi:hypothetical protein
MKTAFWSSSFFGGYGGAEAIVAELLNARAADRKDKTPVA